MKKGLVLSNNQTMRFNDFFADIQESHKFFDYSGYTDLLFIFDNKSKHPASFLNLDTGRKSYEYSGAYITGYSSGAFSDLAFAVAQILTTEKIRIADSELKDAPSLSKISETAKLVSAGVLMPKTYGGTKMAIVRAITTQKIKLKYPLIFKLANGKRGIDNYTIYNENEIFDLLKDKPDDSIWILQEYIESDGFYRLNTYFYKPAYGIYRTNNPEAVDRHHVHMYKPRGGINATFLEPREIPVKVVRAARRASKVVGREFAGVDIMISKFGRKPYIIEVNNYPQLVTVESFKERRVKAFIDAMKKLIVD